MKTVLVRLDKVLHVKRRRGSEAYSKTIFSFISEGRYTPYVVAPGLPKLSDGMTILAVLGTEGDWGSLLGWRNLETGEVVFRRPEVHLQALRLQAAVLALIYLAVFLFFRHNAIQFLIAPTIILLSGMASEYRSWRQSCSDWPHFQALALSDEA